MRTQWLCDHPFMNIVTIQAEFIESSLVEKFDLVPQMHGDGNKWYKIVIMDHVEAEHLSIFIKDLKVSLDAKKSIKI